MAARHLPVKFTKVLGHATQRQVDRGHITQIDKDGNDGADALAVRGAEHHAAPKELTTAAKMRKATAKATHRMMLRILHARQAAEETLGISVDGFEEGDRGSEAGADELLGLMPDNDEESAAEEELLTGLAAGSAFAAVASAATGTIAEAAADVAMTAATRDANAAMAAAAENVVAPNRISLPVQADHG